MTRRVRLKWWVVVVAALVATAVAAGGIAQAAAKKHAISAKAILAQYAASGSTNKDAGVVTGKPGGTAAVLQTNKVNGSSISSKGTVYGKHGTYTYTAKATATGQPDGSVTFAGRGKIKGGTGIYRGATGKFSLTGSAPPNSTVVTLKVIGSITY